MVGFGLDNVEMGRQIAPLVVSLTDDIDHNLRVVVTQSFPREGDPDDYWEVSFAGYVLFMERDESYTVPDGYEVRHGRWLEVFERSRLMDHLPSYTFADDLFPGPLTHYCVCGEDHVVDVVTTATPQVRLLTADEVAALDWEPDDDEEE